MQVIVLATGEWTQQKGHSKKKNDKTNFHDRNYTYKYMEVYYHSSHIEKILLSTTHNIGFNGQIKIFKY